MPAVSPLDMPVSRRGPAAAAPPHLAEEPAPGAAAGSRAAAAAAFAEGAASAGRGVEFLPDGCRADRWWRAAARSISASSSFNRPGPLTETTSVLIPPGADLEFDLRCSLQRHNIIDSPLIFSMAARFNKLELQAAGRRIPVPARRQHEAGARRPDLRALGAACDHLPRRPDQPDDRRQAASPIRR